MLIVGGDEGGSQRLLAGNDFHRRRSLDCVCGTGMMPVKENGREAIKKTVTEDKHVRNQHA